jgi:hypothetical protein
MENGPFIDDFPTNTSINKGFSMAVLNNQMVIHLMNLYNLIWSDLNPNLQVVLFIPLPLNRISEGLGDKPPIPPSNLSLSDYLWWHGLAPKGCAGCAHHNPQNQSTASRLLSNQSNINQWINESINSPACLPVHTLIHPSNLSNPSNLYLLQCVLHFFILY